MMGTERELWREAEKLTLNGLMADELLCIPGVKEYLLEHYGDEIEADFEILEKLS